MIKNHFYILFILAFCGCVSENEKSGVDISTQSVCVSKKVLGKSALSNIGKVIFASKDSLQAEIRAVVACNDAHKEKTSLVNDSTMKVDYISSGSGDGCVCMENINVTAKSAEHDLQLIKQIEFNGFMFYLEKPTP